MEHPEREPGYAGSGDLLTITGLGRQQWSGLAGAPSTQTLTLHSPLPINALGVGLSVVHDEVGPINSTLLVADIAYRIRVTENARLAFGLKAGMDFFNADLAGVPNADAGESFFQQNVSGSASPTSASACTTSARRATSGPVRPSCCSTSNSAWRRAPPR